MCRVFLFQLYFLGLTMSADTLARTSLHATIVNVHADPVTVTDPDPADHESFETIIYGCGTYAPGLIYEPCPHASSYVRCCTCAGCMMDVWSCGKEPDTDSWVWYSANRLGERFDSWVRHPYALMLYALVIIFLLSSQIVQDVLYIFFVILVLGIGFYAYVAGQLLN